ncbi:hypothetical protein X975_04029, partial [Stegodyphus mimosarum]
MLVQTVLINFHTRLNWTKLEFEVTSVISNDIDSGGKLLSFFVGPNDYSISIFTSILVGPRFWKIPCIPANTALSFIDLP